MLTASVPCGHCRQFEKVASNAYPGKQSEHEFYYVQIQLALQGEHL